MTSTQGTYTLSLLLDRVGRFFGKFAEFRIATAQANDAFRADLERIDRRLDRLATVVAQQAETAAQQSALVRQQQDNFSQLLAVVELLLEQRQRDRQSQRTSVGEEGSTPTDGIAKIGSNASDTSVEQQAATAKQQAAIARQQTKNVNQLVEVVKGLLQERRQQAG